MRKPDKKYVAHGKGRASPRPPFGELTCSEGQVEDMLSAGESTEKSLSDTHFKTRSIRVLVVDDHAMVRQGLRCTLEAYPGIEVVGEASDGEEVLASIAKLQPTVVVMDVVMPKMDGIAATRLIKTQYPQIVVVGLTRELKDYTSYSMRKAGASEVVDKKNAVDELYGAIQRALAGIGGKAVDGPEIGPGLGFMPEPT